MKCFLFALCLLLGVWAMPSSWAGGSQELEEVTDFGANPGNLRMQVYLPANLQKGDPLVVLAHGCFQAVQEVFDHSGWVELADRHRFALLFPQTNKENEPFGGCFRTWFAEHQVRGGGEPLSVHNQVVWLLENRQLNPERVYMAGQSSGGLLTAVMLASYPELFAAGAIESAYPYGCAGSFEELALCSQAQRRLSAAEWGDLVRAAAPDYTGTRPPVAIWHGNADTLIAPANLELQVLQWADVLGVDATPDLNDQIDGKLRQRYINTKNTVAIEAVLVTGMDHAIAIDPDGSPPCGSPAPYIVDADICAAYWIGRWFGVVPAPDQ